MVIGLQPTWDSSRKREDEEYNVERLRIERYGLQLFVFVL